MSKPNKRIRSTQASAREMRNVKADIQRVWSTARVLGTSTTEAFAAGLALIAGREWSPAEDTELRCYHWGIRDFVVNTEAKWVLILDGQPTTSHDINAAREMRPDVWDHVTGQMEWKAHPGKLLYTGPAIELMSNVR